MKSIIIIFSLILFPLIIFAQEEWEILDSTNSPLQSNLIRVVESDSLGNIWLGTNHGLYKYDGSSWDNYDTSNSPIPNNLVDNFYIDRNNNIWFMVNRYPYPYFIKFDGENWDSVDTDQTCFPDDSPISRNFVVDGYGIKWVNTFDNMIMYDDSGCTFYDEQNVGILTTDCNKIDVDADDNFFFISQSYEAYHYGGIAKTTLNGWTYNSLSNLGWTVDFTLNKLYGLIWVCTFNNHNGKGELIKMNYDGLQILNVYDYYNPTLQGVKFGKYLAADLNGNVWQSYIEATGGNVSLGLISFLKNTAEWILYDSNNSPLPSDNIKGISVDIYNNKLIATDKGLAIFNEQGITVNVKEPKILSNYQLYQNYPNPFNPITKIKYQLPELSKVKLAVYDVLGRGIRTLVNEVKPSGTYEVDFDGTNLPSGVYFYRIESGSYSDTKKFVLLK